MAKEKIQLAELAELISVQLDINRKSSDDFLKAFVSVMEESLTKNEQVKIKGLGTFKLIWNEPRKSVDVNTGADIIIEGYYKVGFTPEATFKETVNEPYAHLQAISLDEKSATLLKQVKPERPEKSVRPDRPEKVEKPVEEEVVPEESSNSLPLKMLHDQATEIKGILSEIKALRKTEEKPEIPTEEKPEIQHITQPEVKPASQPEIKIEAQPVAQPEKVVPVIVKNEESAENKADKPKEVVPEAPAESKTEAQISDEVKEEKHYRPIQDDEPGKFRTIQAPHFDQAKIDRQVKTPGKRLDVIFVLLMVAAAVIYMLSDMDIFSEFSKLLKSSDTKVEKVREPVYQETILPDTTAIAEDTLNQEDIITEDEEPLDSLELLFNKPRVYKEFIATEEVRVGSRLTRISERYYGVKDFWVYIYEANKEKFISPDEVEPGTILKIPKLDPKLADPNNKRCLEYARKLHDVYVKK